MKINTKLLALFVFISSQVSIVSFGQERFKPNIPKGWVNVTEKVAKSDENGVPTLLIKTSENTLCKILAADPNTFKELYPTYFVQLRIPQMDNFKFTDESLKGLSDGFEESIKGHSDVVLVDDKIYSLNGIKIFRSIIDLNLIIHKKRVVVRSMQYYVPDGNGAATISFYSPRSKWKKYLPIFEKIISKP